ncbi:hypothetical protein AC01_4970 [Escherichia coli 1-392-07_S3_C1]|nr:hypothetical protein AC29_4951 [Escherichia coli 1-392-07_S3_C2]KDW95648.1 hypothetical protein AC01_4970 [Escherichia coli 1-392-07_S3_C1]KEL47196.1 hypothetical protein AB93_4485 [Escherichia coli 5-172-05_S3_C1]
MLDFYHRNYIVDVFLLRSVITKYYIVKISILKWYRKFILYIQSKY